MTLYEEFFEEILGIAVVELFYKAKNYVEKILWLLIFLSGTAWFFFFVDLQFQLWKDDGIVMTSKRIKHSDLDYPAVTFCSQSSNVEGIIERMGNYLDANAEVEDENIGSIRTAVLTCAMEKMSADLNKAWIWEMENNGFNDYVDLYDNYHDYYYYDYDYYYNYDDYNYDYDDDNLHSVSANVSHYKDQCLSSGAKQSFCKVSLLSTSLKINFNNFALGYGTIVLL